jgi:F-type H+-transporting ATPase subunit c
MKHLIVFTFVAAIVIAACGSTPVLAQMANAPAGAGDGTRSHWLLITSGFAMALAAAGCGYAQSKALTAACEGVSRNPGAADSIRFFIILGLAFIEFLALLTFVVAATLLFGDKFWPAA